MLADPHQLVGKRVRFIAIVVDQYGEMERARVRAWTDVNIEVYRNMSKRDSQIIAAELMADLVKKVGEGDDSALPETMRAEGQ